MSVVIIPFDELIHSPVVPVQARPYLTDDQYIQIHQRFVVCSWMMIFSKTLFLIYVVLVIEAAMQGATSQACCLEGCIAIFLCFPCVCIKTFKICFKTLRK